MSSRSRGYNTKNPLGTVSDPTRGFSASCELVQLVRTTEESVNNSPRVDLSLPAVAQILYSVTIESPLFLPWRLSTLRPGKLISSWASYVRRHRTLPSPRRYYLSRVATLRDPFPEMTDLTLIEMKINNPFHHAQMSTLGPRINICLRFMILRNTPDCVST